MFYVVGGITLIPINFEDKVVVDKFIWVPKKDIFCYTCIGLNFVSFQQFTEQQNILQLDEDID